MQISPVSSGNPCPILYKSDVIIAGGSFAGIAAAVEFALAGKSVTLVEPRTYLGREVTATLRPWLSPADFIMPDWLDSLASSSPAKRSIPPEIPLHLDQLKLYLEDLMLAAGVNLVYASLPVQLLANHERLAGMVIANKSGTQALLGQLVLDTTETALCGRLAGAQFLPPPDTALFACTLELTGAQEFKERIIPVPGEIGVQENRVILHESTAGADPMYIEFHLRLPAGADLRTAMQRDLAARFTSLRLAAHLLTQDVHFYWGNWSNTSYELSGLHCSPMTASIPAWAQPLGETVQLHRKRGGSCSIPLRAFAGPLQGLWCLNESARLTGYDIQLEHPIHAASLGKAAAEAILGLEIGPVARPVSLNEAWEPGMIPCISDCDVLVVGGGTSGATAAAASGQMGARTVLVEMNPGLGGTGTFGGIISYWMSNRVGFVPRIQKAVEKIEEQIHFSHHPPWVMWNAQAKMLALLQEALEAGVEVIWNGISFGVLVESQAIRGVLLATRYGPAKILSQVSIDATGDGDLAAFAGAEFALGNAEDASLMWTAFPYVNTPGAGNGGNFTGSVDVTSIRDLTRGILAGRRRNWKAEKGAYRAWPGKDSWKTFQENAGKETELDESRRPGLARKNLAQVKPLSIDQLIYDHGIYMAPRESRHIWGEVVLTHSDQLRQRKWPDVIVQMFSNYDVKGASVSDWNRIGLLPPNLMIEIPYRAILPRRVEGLLVVGKAFSARSDAVPSIRMQPDLENLGGAAGLAAALCIKTGCTPRSLDVSLLQQHLVKSGVLPPNITTRPYTLVEYSHADLVEMAKAIQAQPALWEYNNMPLDQVFSQTLPLVEIASAGERAIPVLIAELSQASGDRAVVLAQCLALLGSNAGVPVLVERLQQIFAGETLPPRQAFVFNANRYPPDQGAMPEAVYLLYSLGMTRDPRCLVIWEEVADLLVLDDQAVRDAYAGPLLYVDALCYGAERLGDPRAIPLLQRIRHHPLLHERWNMAGPQPDFIQERLTRTEISLARALARCGDREGYQILVNYLHSAPSLHFRAAFLALRAVSRQDLPADPHAWQAWLDQQETLTPSPNLTPANIDSDRPGEFFR